MSLDSIKKLGYSPEKEEAYREWLKAHQKYKAECSLFQRVRRLLPRLEHCSPEQVILLYAAKERFRKECKIYYDAQTRWNAFKLEPIPGASPQNQLDSLLARLQEIVQGAKAPTATSLEDAALKEKFGSIEGNPQLEAIAQAARSRQAAVIVPEDQIEDFDSPVDSPVSLVVGEDEVESPEEIIRKYGVPSPERQDVKPDEAA